MLLYGNAQAQACLFLAKKPSLGWLQRVLFRNKKQIYVSFAVAIKFLNIPASGYILVYFKAVILCRLKHQEIIPSHIAMTRILPKFFHFIKQISIELIIFLLLFMILVSNLAGQV